MSSRRLRQGRATLALGLFTGALLAALVFVAACSSASEGERCQLANANDDCADGLVCTSSTKLPLDPIYQGGVADGEGRCCPSDLSRSTATECKQTPAAPGTDSAIPPEAGGDGGGDAPTEGGQSDAPADAPAEADVPDAPVDANDAG